ncbi:MAG: hypothetical protein ACXWWC_10020 [Chitinophagaceae bacterium]
MKKVRSLSIINFLALLLHISFSYLTQFRLINSTDVGQVSDNYDSIFTPAGITFAIWGIIYAALLLFCIYHIVVAYRHDVDHPANEDVNRIGIWFILNNTGAAAWLLVWTNEMITASLGLIIFQLIALIIINLRIGIHNPLRSISSKFFTQFPLSIYFGWLTIATIANASIYFLASGWDGLGYGPIYWTRVVIGLAVFLTALVVFMRRNVFYGIVIIWALYGIILKRQSADVNAHASIIKTAWIGLGIVGLVCLIQFVKNISLQRKLPVFGNAKPTGN